MNKKEINNYKDKRNLSKGFNAFWNQGFDEAIALLNSNINNMKITEISIGNYYGNLNLMTLNNKFYWCVENYNTDFGDLDCWAEINEEVYNSIISFNNKQV